MVLFTREHTLSDKLTIFALCKCNKNLIPKIKELELIPSPDINTISFSIDYIIINDIFFCNLRFC